MRRVWQPLAIVAGLLLLLTYLLIQSQSPDLALRARLQEALQSIQLHDTELTRDVLLARAGLLPHYDALPQTGQHLWRALEALHTESATLVGPAAREMRQHVEALTAVLRQKLILVEYFTSDNALLQNSVMYLTYTGQTLGARLAVEQAVAADIAALSHAMLRFMHTPDQGVGAEVEAALQRLAPMAASQRELQGLVAHGRLLREVLPQVDTLLRQILTAPTTARVDALQDAVLQYAHRVEARAQVFRVLLYLVAVILLGYLLYQYARLRSHARALRRANADLRASEERSRAITESANDAIISADSAGNIVSWNTRAEAIFGYKAAEILGAPLMRLIPARYQTAHRQRFAQWAATGASRLVGTTVEFSGVRQDGSEFPLELSLSTWSTAHDHYVTSLNFS